MTEKDIIEVTLDRARCEARLDTLNELLEFPEVEVYMRLRLDQGFTHEEAVKCIKIYLEETKQ